MGDDHDPQPKITIPRIGGPIGLHDLLSSVVTVDDGRGFIIAVGDTRYVVTAAHCLPFRPPPHLGRHLEEATDRFAGGGGAKRHRRLRVRRYDGRHRRARTPGQSGVQRRIRSIRGVFLDLAAVRHHRAAAAWSSPGAIEPAQLYTGRRGALPGPSPVDRPSMDRLRHPAFQRSASDRPEELAEGGMSGSPLISATGAALGVISTSNQASVLTDGLPGWLLRALACAS
jgi:hypothetical protein